MLCCRLLPLAPFICAGYHTLICTYRCTTWTFSLCGDNVQSFVVIYVDSVLLPSSVLRFHLLHGRKLEVWFLHSNLTFQEVLFLTYDIVCHEPAKCVHEENQFSSTMISDCGPLSSRQLMLHLKQCRYCCIHHDGASNLRLNELYILSAGAD
jgi:hypothetical protein